MKVLTITLLVLAVAFYQGITAGDTRCAMTAKFYCGNFYILYITLLYMLIQYIFTMMIIVTCNNTEGAKAIDDFRQCLTSIPKGSAVLKLANEQKPKGYDECYKAVLDYIKGNFNKPTDEERKSIKPCRDKLNEHKPALAKCGFAEN